MTNRHMERQLLLHATGCHHWKPAFCNQVRKCQSTRLWFFAPSEGARAPVALWGRATSFPQSQTQPGAPHAELYLSALPRRVSPSRWGWIRLCLCPRTNVLLAYLERITSKHKAKITPISLDTITHSLFLKDFKKKISWGAPAIDNLESCLPGGIDQH